MAKSTLSSLLPLIILFVVIAVGAVVGFVVYGIINEVANTTSKKMEKHNVSFSKDGMKVGVKGKSAERVGDDTQSVLMKVWNASAWPAYRSRLGWGQAKETPALTPSQEKRSSYFRTDSPRTSSTGLTPGQEKRNPFTRSGSSLNAKNE